MTNASFDTILERLSAFPALKQKAATALAASRSFAAGLGDDALVLHADERAFDDAIAQDRGRIAWDHALGWLMLIVSALVVLTILVCSLVLVRFALTDRSIAPASFAGLGIGVFLGLKAGLDGLREWRKAVAAKREGYSGELDAEISALSYRSIGVVDGMLSWLSATGESRTMRTSNVDDARIVRGDRTWRVELRDVDRKVLFDMPGLKPSDAEALQRALKA